MSDCLCICLFVTKMAVMIEIIIQVKFSGNHRKIDKMGFTPTKRQMGIGQIGKNVLYRGIGIKLYNQSEICQVMMFQNDLDVFFSIEDLSIEAVFSILKNLKNLKALDKKCLFFTILRTSLFFQSIFTCNMAMESY